ncbi:MAG: UbiX family flavin prenyltransferase [Myxococcales bacterium FL481]|nr:MAG: UbiX family flavin prenyltransferase [Myxococcales bacterium FL481]
MRFVLAITGASGSVYAQRTLHALRSALSAPGSTLIVHVVASNTAHVVWRQELPGSLAETLQQFARTAPRVHVWANEDFSAPFASGSNAADAVVVAPCSMSSLGRVAHGTGTGLLHRACDVALKERRRLILVARETPLSRIHLLNMLRATEAGAVVLPAVPSFYSSPTSVDAVVDTVVARALDHAGVRNTVTPRWGESAHPDA